MRSIITILKKPYYATIAGVAAGTLFVFVALFPNAMLVGEIITNGDISFREAASIISGLVGGIAMSQGVVVAMLTVLSSVLFGINLALVVYTYRRGTFQVAAGGAVSSVAGAGASMLVTGCAACGTLAFPALAPVISALGLSALLPFVGAGFGILSAIMLLVSLYFLVRRIDHGTTCELSS